MNVLVIGHTYISRVGREKWRVMAREYSVRLKIVVPSAWRDYLFTLRYDEHRDEELDMVPLRVFFSGKEAAHVYRSLAHVFRSFRPDILHVEEGTDAVSYLQALWLRRLFAPSARTVFFTWMNFEKRLKFPFPLVERFNLRHSDAAICGNSDARDILRRKGFAKPIHVLPLLGVDAERFSPGSDPAFRESLGLRGPVIGFIGRFVQEKGVLDLIDAVARMPAEADLLFVGGGSLERDMLERAGAHGIAERIRIVPPVRHEEIPHYLRAMDVLVLPSYTVPHWKEQFGQVLVQAMACEVPVVGSRHGEIPNVVGDAGFLFPERDIESLASILARLLASEELRRSMGKKGRMRVLAEYTDKRIAERTVDVYRALLGT
ncbi:MAG: glycosyltransferase [Bacteroidota bacterium]|nr:glycosyltransferase [Bacteroidota bacterium]